MNKLIKTYYDNFESYKSIWTIKNKAFIFFIIFLAMFFLSVISFFYQKKLLSNFDQDYLMFFMLFNEGCTLLLLEVLKKQRNKKVKSKFMALYNNNNLSLHQIKKKWFSDALAIPNYEYLNLIEKIEKYDSMKSKYSTVNISRDKVYDFIFSSDSKNRVLAMFMGSVALFTALLISNGVNVEYLFSLFQSISVIKSLVAIFFISLFIFGIVYILKYMNYMLMSCIDFILDNISSSQRVSKRKQEILILQLLDLAELPKQKKKMYAVLQVSKDGDKMRSDE